MLIPGLIAAAYLFIALIALLMTYQEHLQTGGRSLMLKTLSFLACVLWPLTVMIVAIAIVARRNTDKPHAPEHRPHVS